MGLDMRLSKRTYVWSADRENVSIEGVKGIDPQKVSGVIEDMGYWRKANAIHKWFVDNVQDGEDDCKEYYVTVDELKKLLDTVNKVLASCKLVKGKVNNGYKYENGKETPILEDGKYVKDPTTAKELLPTTEGCFFGGTDYDQYYVDDLKMTKKILEEVLKDPSGDYYYSSSW